MKADTLTIKKVFVNDTMLEIPFYQRHYVWDEEKHQNWSRFAEEMENTMNTNQTTFFGSLILKKVEKTDTDRANGVSTHYIVVDGQQRMTTICIYMKLLHMMTDRMEEFNSHYMLDPGAAVSILRHNCEDKADFDAIMSLDTPKDLSARALSNIINAYEYFRIRFLSLSSNGINLNDLRNSIYSNVQFVAIELNTDDNEQKIFDTINSLGVDLTTDELLKNYLYGINDKYKYESTWKRTFDSRQAQEFWGTDAAATRQKKGDRTIDRFLHAFVRVKMWDFKDQLTPVQKKEFVKKENVYTTCQAFVKDFGMSRLALADEIISYAELYKKYLDPDILNHRVPNYAGIERVSCIINALQLHVITPYVLYILKNVNTQSERNKIFSHLETYLIRRILAHTNDNSYSDLFSENLIGQKVASYDGFVEYISNRDGNLAMPSDNELSRNLLLYSIDEVHAQLVWYLFETKLTPASDPTFQCSFSSVEVEQLMPSPNSYNASTWIPLSDPDEELDRKTMAKTLGNWFLLAEPDTRMLNKVKNAPLAKKLTTYRQWDNSVRSSHAKLAGLTSWTVDDIRLRNIDYATSLAQNVWRV